MSKTAGYITSFAVLLLTLGSLLASHIDLQHSKRIDKLEDDMAALKLQLSEKL